MKRGTPEHPKTYLLASALQIPKWGSIGILESIWHFTAQYAQAGNIGRHSDDAIARHIGWQTDSYPLIRALVITGWLDRCECHRLRVHDWHEHADQTVQRVLKNRNDAFLECYGDASTKLAASYDETSQPLPLPLPVSVAVAVANTVTPPSGGVMAVQINTNGDQNLAERFVQVYNAALGRRVGMTPQIKAKIDARLRAGYKAWQILSLPILVASRQMGAEMEKVLRPEVLLRDGKHPRTTSAGYTAGATDWLERELQQLDRTVLSERLAALAQEAGVLTQLLDMGVSVRKETGL